MSTNTDRTIDVEAIRRDFPVLERKIYDRPLVYLDNAATSQKPQCVIDAVSRYYAETNSNVHRGVHRLSMDATSAYEAAREKLQRFLNARSTKEIVWTRGTTESINLVAQSLGRSKVQAGDEVLISQMEHHSNIVPWQLLCEERGATLKVIPMSEQGDLVLDAYEEMLSDRTKIVAVAHVSNALGTLNPVEHIIERAHARGVPVLLDGAQATPHMKVDVQALNCDFYTVSGHKMFGPTGIGALYGKEALLDAMPPWHGGGDMIKSVSFDGTVFNDLPYKFEAGTPNIAGAIGMGVAVDYLEQVGLDAAAAWEAELLEYGTALLNGMDGVRIFGTAAHKAAVISFEVRGIHPHDLGTILDREGVAIRAGHHCAQPVMEFYGVAATARASMAFYNTKSELDALAAAIEKAQDLFA
ncbi:MAG: cysteine desulfurase [Planctomycetota bacterium]|nr:cysteine desulfurase CsdA [Planctomycetota bacterium]MEE2713152.1 cysteine desulfurase [Planctomycetota bacterium]